MEKRVVLREKKAGLTISDVILVGVLLAVGAVLKFFVGSMFNAGMKPNFIIAMYCLAILLIKPRFFEAIVIGIIAGAICQVFPGTPYLNLVSEPVGALIMAVLVYLPLQIKSFSLKPIIGTFLSTLASGLSFLGVLYAAFYAGADVKAIPFSMFIVIILGTAVVNAIIVQLLYIPLKLALGRDIND
ncbi:MAG TPA: tryptophan transporter [Ruminiclostridium sp.]|nr:tryptophan transporter [Ruminiclostridium sp.]